LELPDPILCDEFTSVVDRQVAQIGSHAVQKYIRANKRKFVAVSCHYDIVDWLQPDWIFEPGTMSFTRRLLRRRPDLQCEISRIPFPAWGLFAPFHYLTADLNRSARCFGLFCEGHLASFAGVIHRCHPKVRDIKGVSRLVTLPDWQGLGLAMILVDRLGKAYRGAGLRLRCYPAHPALVRSFDKSPEWAIIKEPGFGTGTIEFTKRDAGKKKARPCAVFEFAGEKMNHASAVRLIG
jgi:GNAT superfamily N-acetyltransferase